MKKLFITEDSPFYDIKKELDISIEGHDLAKIALFIAILTKEHIYVEGPPATAKTALAEFIAKSMALKFFFYQMHRDMRLSELTKGDYLIETFLSDTWTAGGEKQLKKWVEHEPYKKGILAAEIALLDDITRAPGEALNVLFRIMNERKIQDEDIPLMTTIATSNPTILSNRSGSAFNRMYYNEPLDPGMLDRLLIHIKIESFIGRRRFDKVKTLLKKSAEHYQDKYTPTVEMDKKRLVALQNSLHSVIVPDHVIDLLIRVYEVLFPNKNLAENIIDSDGTFGKKIIKLMRASAILSGNDICTPEDIYVLRFVTAFRIPELHERIEDIIGHVLSSSQKTQTPAPEKKEEEITQKETSSRTVDPFQAPQKTETPQGEKESEKEEENAEENLETRVITPQNKEEIEENTEEGTFLGFDPFSKNPGSGNIVLHGKKITEHIEGTIELFRDIAEGKRKGTGKEELVSAGGIPRGWQMIRSFSDINRVSPIDIATEEISHLRIPKEEEQKDDAIGLLRDVSTSMSETNAEVASRIHNAIIAIAEYYRLPILYIEFHSDLVIRSEDDLLFTRNYSRLKERVSITDVRSATNYQQALQGFLIALIRQEWAKHTHLIVTGDGRANQGDPLAIDEIRELQKRNVKTYAIYTETAKPFYSEGYPELFKKLARDTQGRTYDVELTGDWRIRKRTDVLN